MTSGRPMWTGKGMDLENQNKIKIEIKSLTTTERKGADDTEDSKMIRNLEDFFQKLISSKD